MRVRSQPAVGGGRAQVQLGRAAVQRAPRRRHPARVGVGGEERRLLGVGAEPGADRERHSRRPRRRRHPVVRGADVGAHPLAVPVGQRARVAAAARPALHSGPAAARRRRLRGRARGDADRAGGRRAGAVRAGQGICGYLRVNPDMRPHGRPGAGTGAWEGDRQQRGLDAVALRRPERRRLGALQVLRAREVARVRRAVREPGGGQRSRQVVAHAARGRERREVGRALHPPLPGYGPADRGQHQRAADDRKRRREHGRQRLAALAPARARPEPSARCAPAVARGGRRGAARRARAGPPARWAPPSPPWRGAPALAARRRPARRASARAAARPAAARRPRPTPCGRGPPPRARREAGPRPARPARSPPWPRRRPGGRCRQLPLPRRGGRGARGRRPPRPRRAGPPPARARRARPAAPALGAAAAPRRRPPAPAPGPPQRPRPRLRRRAPAPRAPPSR